MQTIKVLIIEVDQIRREGLISVLSREMDICVIGAGNNVIQALENISPPMPPDVVIIDMDDPTLAAPRNWALLRCALPRTAVMVLTTEGDDRMLEAALGLGAIALYQHNAETRAICEAVRNASRGVADVDPLLVERIKKILMFSAAENEIGLRAIQHPIRMRYSLTSKRPVHLTQREREVLALLREGKSNRQIALLLEIKVKTVEFHVSNLLKKLGVASRVEAAVLAPWLIHDSRDT